MLGCGGGVGWGGASRLVKKFRILYSKEGPCLWPDKKTTPTGPILKWSSY